MTLQGQLVVWNEGVPMARVAELYHPHPSQSCGSQWPHERSSDYRVAFSKEKRTIPKIFTIWWDARLSANKY